jgi:hypothetical protein
LRLIPNLRQSSDKLLSRFMYSSMNCFLCCMGDVSFQGKAHFLASTVTHVFGLICHLLTDLSRLGCYPSL